MNFIKRFARNVCSLFLYVHVMWVSFSASAGEISSKLTDSQIDAAYDGCKFSLDAPDNPALLSNGARFSYLRETYRGGFCKATLDAPMAASLATGDDADYCRNIPINIKRKHHLQGYEKCKDEPNYDVCQEKAILKYHGFQEGNKGLWRKLTFIPQSGFGISLEQSLSSVVDESILNEDGFTVVAKWEHPYAFYKQPEKNILSLFVVRKTQFGYITVGGDGAIAIPLGNTPESRAEAKALADQIIKVVQSVRMESIN